MAPSWIFSPSLVEISKLSCGYMGARLSETCMYVYIHRGGIESCLKRLSVSDRIRMTCCCGTVHEMVDDGNNPDALVNPVTPKNQHTLARFLLGWANKRQTGTHSITDASSPCVSSIPHKDYVRQRLQRQQVHRRKAVKLPTLYIRARQPDPRKEPYSISYEGWVVRNALKRAINLHWISDTELLEPSRWRRVHRHVGGWISLERGSIPSGYL
jgi:hypothetical protein